MTTRRSHWKVLSLALGVSAASGGTCLAQPGVEEFASGLLHHAAGGAVLGPVSGRRLPVHNLGSSGQDGVEVRLASMFGGGVMIDSEAYNNTPGSRLKIKIRGWDGTIYGNHRRTNNGDGTSTETFDFSDVGAVGVNVSVFGSDGSLTSTTSFNGPVADVGGVANRPIFCPCGWVTVYWWATVNGKPHLVSRNYCPCAGGTGTPSGGNTHMEHARMVTPILPDGAPDLLGLDSMLITAEGLTDLTLEGSDLGTYGVASWGIGQAHIGETCPGGTVCGPDERRVPVTNIGSSGQDGVEIRWPKAVRASYQCDGPTPSSGGLGSQMTTSVHWIQPSWSNSKEFRVMQSCDGSGTTGMSFDTSAFGNVPIRVTTYVGTTPTGGGEGGPLGYLINTNTLDWILAHPIWAFNHGVSLRVSNLTHPDGTPIMVTLVLNGTVSMVPADRIDVELLTTDQPAGLVGVTMTAADVGGNQFEIGGLQTVPMPPPCVADVDDGSGTGTPDGGVGIEDLLFYLGLYDQGLSGADVDDGSGTGTRDGGIGIEDLLYYLQRYDSGC